VHLFGSGGVKDVIEFDIPLLFLEMPFGLGIFHHRGHRGHGDQGTGHRAPGTGAPGSDRGRVLKLERIGLLVFAQGSWTLVGAKEKDSRGESWFRFCC
jgi:hypothetical protein